MELVTPRPAAELSTAAEGLTTKQREVLEAVRSFPEGGTVSQIGAALGMHINTARGHLDVLVDRGLVSWCKVPSERRGRPTHLYTVRSPNSSVLAGGYVALVEVLAEASTHGSIGTATELGHAWGQRYLRELERWGATSTVPSNAEEAMEIAIWALGAMGFDPYERAGRPAGASSEIGLRACPFITGDGERPAPTVCAMHAAFLNEVSGRVNVELLPFDQPGQCGVRLSGPSETS